MSFKVDNSQLNSLKTANPKYITDSIFENLLQVNIILLTIFILLPTGKCYLKNKLFFSCKVQFFLLKNIILGFCQNFWTLTRADDTSPKYEALIEKTLANKPNDTYQYCSGVILNNRYVLTIYSCTRDHNQ